jgi:hypothetical protein
MIGRSWESFENAGYEKELSGLDLVVCTDVTDRTAFLDEWFVDVHTVVCVARPRSLKEGDRFVFKQMVANLSDAACVNNVPRMLLHGLPYVEANKIGETATMRILKESEGMAKKRFRGETRSSLTISRINEMSEIGHLLEFAQIIRCWPCACACNPLLHPVTARDFAKAVADFSEGDHKNHELLVGGPYQITYRDLGASISNVCDRPLPFITLPLIAYKVLIWILSFLGRFSPMFRGMCISLKLCVLPMTTHTANDKFVCIGSDTIEEYLREHATPGKLTWVHEKMYGPKFQQSSFVSYLLPSTKQFALLVGFFAASDGIVAIYKPGIVKLLQNVDVEGVTTDRFLLLGTGVAGTSIAAMTFLSLQDHKRASERAVTTSIAIGLLLNAWFCYFHDIPTVLGVNLTMIHIFNAMAILSLVVKKTSNWVGAKALSLMTTVTALVHFIFPDLMTFSLGLDVATMSERTKQLSRQTSMYYLSSGVQMFALCSGAKPESAAGLVSLTWFLCSLELWVIARHAKVFDMSEMSRALNMSFPIIMLFVSARILLGP